MITAALPVLLILPYLFYLTLCMETQIHCMILTVSKSWISCTPVRVMVFKHNTKQGSDVTSGNAAESFDPSVNAAKEKKPHFAEKRTAHWIPAQIKDDSKQLAGGYILKR